MLFVSAAVFVYRLEAFVILRKDASEGVDKLVERFLAGVQVEDVIIFFVVCQADAALFLCFVVLVMILVDFFKVNVVQLFVVIDLYVFL